MLCNGQAISRTVYADLFNRVGTKFGAGNGTTTFNLPDLRGRSVFGRDDMGGTAAGRLTQSNFGADPKVVGSVGGGESTTMALANLIQHDHAVYLNDPGHNHDYQKSSAGGTQYQQGGFTPNSGYTSTKTSSDVTGITIWSGAGGTGNQNKVASTGSATPTPIRTVPPGIIMNIIIRVSFDG
jgi:microcystin-dependent protein